jgi:hypothetical protein
MTQFGEKLYGMRCAVTHDGMPVTFGGVPDRESQDGAPPHLTLWDTYSVRDGQFVMYETALRATDTIDILRNGLRRCFEDGSCF